MMFHFFSSRGISPKGFNSFLLLGFLYQLCYQTKATPGRERFQSIQQAFCSSQESERQRHRSNIIAYLKRRPFELELILCPSVFKEHLTRLQQNCFREYFCQEIHSFFLRFISFEYSFEKAPFINREGTHS